MPAIRPNPISKDPFWYKRGVIYEIHVRAFQDSNGDGTGDFPGLTSRLDHLRDLGVTAVWLLPFYPSPLKDDGYDIADYYRVHPMYGTLSDFKVFLREAHRRGLRVITELVMNHTSDQHPWFQRARRSPPGSRWRDYYVWSDNPDKYKGTRIIFKDTEISNWTWDPVGNAYFWHRFYSHQPDLNFDHPAVHKEMFKTLDFWLDLGVDGVRLDAIPYLYEREGTSCENLPETHEFLKSLRKHVDEKYGERMLLAEANQWPDDAVAYFGGGKGDESHMVFHFPLMPRLFMSLRMEDRTPIVDILDQTPPIPETAQWALFLRNHDELTLEMVTDEERDYMYRMYAALHQARLNLGIRRRLAPLLGYERKRIELMNALLFSLPGTPVLYYGDEIGMGENIYLGDRNGVRTPMQWSADKNAGFSRANPQSLYLPIHLDPENHYEAVNVEVQQRNPHSLLWWMRRLIALHKRWKAFGLGTLEFLHPENRKVLACIRRYEDECILVVANLSRFVQPCDLDLSAFRGRIPVELFGRTEFPPIGEKPYFLTLGPHVFYWFSLETRSAVLPESAAAPVSREELPALGVEADWEEVFEERHHLALERILQRWLPSRRWFGGKARTIKAIHVQENIRIAGGANKSFLAFVEVEYAQIEPELYVLPLRGAFGDEAERILQEQPHLALARLKSGAQSGEGILFDALASPAFCRSLLELIVAKRRTRGENGELQGLRFNGLRDLTSREIAVLEPSISKAEQSNSSVVFGDRLVLKFFRRLEAGVNPDLEISRFLGEREYAHTPALAGALEYHRESEQSTVAILTAFVPGCKDAWDYTLDSLSRFYDRLNALPQESRHPSLPSGSIVELAANPIPEQALDVIGTYIESARLLGVRTAEMHLALASETANRDFSPEPLTPHAQRGLFQSMRNLTRRNFQLLDQKSKNLPADIKAIAREVLQAESEIFKRFRPIYERPLNAVRIRNHGDFHLGQVLYTGKNFLILDFEGEPAISLGERRLKRSPLQDVAGMIRSFHYVAHAALLKQIERGTIQPSEVELMQNWSRFWARWVSAVFFRAYRTTSGDAPFLPGLEQDLRMMMDVFLLRKAIYELGYELNNRPDWVQIPLHGIRDLLGQTFS